MSATMGSRTASTRAAATRAVATRIAALLAAAALATVLPDADPATATPPPGSVEAGVRAGATAAVSAGARDGGAAGALPVPDAELATPATGSLGAGRHDVFSLSGNDMTHRYRLRGGSWRREVNRGGTLASQPVVVSWGPGRLDAFARRG